MNRLQLNSHDGDENRKLVVHPKALHALPIKETAAASDADDFAVIIRFLHLLWKHKGVIVAATLLGSIAATAVTLWPTPMYLAKASLEIQNIQEPFGKAPTADSTLQTQVQLLSSASMQDRVVARLLAKKDVRPPKIYGPVAGLRRILGMAEPAETVSWSKAVYTAAGTTRITNAKESRILIITSQSSHPLAASEYANALAEEYIKRNQEERWESYQNTGEWLTRAQQELKAKVEESDRKLVDFAKSKGLIITGAQNVAEEKLKLLQSQLLTASADRIAKQAAFDSSQTDPNQALPAVLDYGPMGQYETKLADLRRELADLSTTLTPSHFRVQRVQAQIDELEKQREKERTNIITRIKIDYQAAMKRENELRHAYDVQAGSLAGQADEMLQYNLLQREAETNKKLYDVALQQGKEASLASAMRLSSARVVDEAFTPVVPFKPSLPLNVALGIFGGLLCGALFVVVRSRTDATIQAPGILEMQFNLRELGVIPAAAIDPEIRRLTAVPRAIGNGNGNGNGNGRGKTKLAGASGDSLELVTWNRKPSPIAEAFRGTMTSILFSEQGDNKPRAFVITSPSPQEGKSTVISNLAIALAEVNQRVLLIDADMRLPRLHSIFDLPNTFGLTDVLNDRKPVDEYVLESLAKKTHIPNLFVLPAGPARSNLARLLYSGRLNELILRFKEIFDAILIDTAPVLSVPDSRLLARAADGIILVVRARKTHQDAAFAAAKCFVEDGHRIIGTILNDWDPNMAPYGHYTSYGTYYSQYHRAENQ